MDYLIVKPGEAFLYCFVDCLLGRLGAQVFSDRFFIGGVELLRNIANERLSQLRRCGPTTGPYGLVAIGLQIMDGS